MEFSADQFQIYEIAWNSSSYVVGSSYSCEQLFSTMNFIKSERRNRLTDDMSSACVTLKFTKYEPSINKLSATLQQQKSQNAAANKKVFHKDFFAS